MIPSIAVSSPFFLPENNILPASSMIDLLQQMLLQKPELRGPTPLRADLALDMTLEEHMRLQMQNCSSLVCSNLLGIQKPQFCRAVAQLPNIDKDLSSSSSSSSAGMQPSQGYVQQSNCGSGQVKSILESRVLSDHPLISRSEFGQANFRITPENQLLLKCNGSPYCSIDNAASSGLLGSFSKSCNKRTLEEANTQRFQEPCTPRPRWCPTAEQIQLLEALFNSGTTTPSRDMIVEIAARLKQYGDIAEANVFYWFQNRKARAKRKLQLPATADGTCGQKEGRNRSRRVSTKTNLGSSPRTSDVSQSTAEAVCKPMQDIVGRSLQSDCFLRQQLLAIGRSIADSSNHSNSVAMNDPLIQQDKAPSNSHRTLFEQKWQWPGYPVVHQQQQTHPIACSTVDNKHDFYGTSHELSCSTAQEAQESVCYPDQKLLAVDAQHQLLSSSNQQTLTALQGHQLSCSSHQDINVHYPQHNLKPTQTAVETSSTQILPHDSVCYPDGPEGSMQTTQAHQFATDTIQKSDCYPQQNFSAGPYRRTWLEALRGLPDKSSSGESTHCQAIDPIESFRNMNFQHPQRSELCQNVAHELLENGGRYEPINVNLHQLAEMLAATDTSNMSSITNLASESKASSMPIFALPTVHSTAVDSLVVSVPNSASVPSITDCELPLWEVLASYGQWESAEGIGQL